MIILQWILAVAMFGAGAMKLFMPADKLTANPKMAWVNDTGLGVARFAGATELAAAAVFAYNAVSGELGFLVAIAAAGVALQLAVAVVWIHSDDPLAAKIPPALLAVLAAVLAFLTVNQLG